MKVAVLLGGKSAEREVSLKTGEAIYQALLRRGYQAIKIDVDDDLWEALKKEQPKVAFIALHGRYGEDGTVQGLLELLEIPYTGSGVLASSLAMDKVMAKRVFREEGVPVAPDVVVEESQINEDRILSEISLPVIVKPSREGSTIGVTIVHRREELSQALKEALQYDNQILIEKYITGRLLTVSLIGSKPEALPIIEIRAKKGFYDYESKYTKGMTEYIVPAELPPTLADQISLEAIKAHRALGCESISRVDIILGDDGKIYVLEVNTIPGMTETSLVPQAAAAAGISFEELVERILKEASLKLKSR